MRRGTTSSHIVRVAPVSRTLRSSLPPLPHVQRVDAASAVIDHFDASCLTVTFTEHEMGIFRRLIDGVIADLRAILEGELPPRARKALTRHLADISSIELGPPGTYRVSADAALELIKWGTPLSIGGRDYTREEALRYLAARAGTN